MLKQMLEQITEDCIKHFMGKAVKKKERSKVFLELYFEKNVKVAVEMNL